MKRRINFEWNDDHGEGSEEIRFGEIPLFDPEHFSPESMEDIIEPLYGSPPPDDFILPLGLESVCQFKRNKP